MLRYLVLPLLALPVCASCAASSEVGREYGVYDLESQRISGDSTITLPGVDHFTDVDVIVTVDEAGDVIDVRPNRRWNKSVPDAALAAARTWKFRPQTFDGHPIRAVGSVSIDVLPPEQPPDAKVPFPSADPSDVEITLERTACFGMCPDYKVSIGGDGKVVFSTRDAAMGGTAADVHLQFEGRSVLWSGTHEAWVSPEDVAALVGKFRAAHFMGLKPEYVASVTDNPTSRLTLRVGGVTKQVVDYVGHWVGMPTSVKDLEDAVDELAGTERWVRGSAGTIALLKEEGFDFRSSEAAILVRTALVLNILEDDRANASELVEAVIAEGLDLSTPVDISMWGRSGVQRPIGNIITSYAVRAGNEQLFDRMAGRGQLARMSEDELDAAFLGGAGCSASIARALVEAGANPKANGDDGNALHAARESYGVCREATSERRVAFAQALVELGVPLEAPDDLGWTPLMATDDPALAQALIDAGADVNARAEDGTTPILSIDDDRVAILLLRAGADPRARDGDGTVRDQAKRYLWPATLAWLDEHGIK